MDNIWVDFDVLSGLRLDTSRIREFYVDVDGNRSARFASVTKGLLATGSQAEHLYRRIQTAQFLRTQAKTSDGRDVAPALVPRVRDDMVDFGFDRWVSLQLLSALRVEGLSSLAGFAVARNDELCVRASDVVRELRLNRAEVLSLRRRVTVAEALRKAAGDRG